MKKLRTVVLLLCLAGLVSCMGAANSYKKKPSLPTVDGRIKVPGLNGPVDVHRDQYGIPHIFSENEHDLFFATGYVQAQDRLFEMVMLRAVAEGRVSELFGDISVPGPSLMGFKLSTVAIDQRQRTMGLKWIGDSGEAMLKKYNPEIYAQLQAYSDGVNAFIAGHQAWADLPVEFQVLRVKPEPFRVGDVASLGAFIASMLVGNMDVELLRYTIAKKYGLDRMWELLPLHDSPGPTIVPPELLKNKLAVARDLPPGGRPGPAELGDINTLSANAAGALYLTETTIKSLLYADYPLASNDWVVSGKLTENGHAMLANDPHLTHIEPSLFYIMHVKGAGFDAYGVTFPGNPYVVLGHARKLSWGCTTSMADAQDLFIETVDHGHPGQYKYKGEWRPFTYRDEIIRVRGVGGTFQERHFKIRQTVHGPVVNDMFGLKKDEPPLAMRWTGWDFDRNLKAFDAMVSATDVNDLMARMDRIPAAERHVMNIAIMYNHFMKGSNLDDFLKGMDQIVAPDQSWVAADADGRIAYLPGGFVPIRKHGVGVMPVPGESGEFDWTGFVPVSELPQAIDPPRGYMATANNEVVDAEWYPYVFATNYGSGWRAWRIEELIQKLAPLNMAKMKQIQNDVYVKQAEWHMTFIERAMNHLKPTNPLAQRAYAELKAWDLQADLDATAPIVFFTYLKTLRRNTLSDEVSPEDYKEYLASGELEELVEMALKNGREDLFDDRRTKAVETSDDMIVKSLAEAMAAVDKLYGPDPQARAWGKIHVIKWYHPLGFGPLKDLAVGPYPHIGASNTVRNAGGSQNKDGIIHTMGGPVLRHIMDMGDPDGAQIVIDGSESGQWLSPNYRDLHQLYVHSEYVTAVMDPERVKKETKNHLVLEP